MMSPQLFPIVHKSNLLLFLLLSSAACHIPLNAQHLIGVRSGYNISGIDFKRNDTPKSINTFVNFSLLYIYYHPMWQQFPYFGLQTGISYSETGFSMPGLHDELYDITKYQVLTIPVVSQFHIDFWKMRILVNLGAFGGYRLSANQTSYTSDGKRIKKDLVFDCYDTRPDFGFIGGGGLAVKINSFELHLECNYNYSLSMLYNPKINSNTYPIYVYPHQLIFSMAFYYRLSK